LVGFDFSGGVLACPKFPDSGFFDVEADDPVFLGEFDGEGQTHVAETDYRDSGAMVLQVFQEIREHGFAFVR
jgi:hypothetical protein